MELKKRAFEFTTSMILFYFLSTSILNWINGIAFYDFGFYSIVLFLWLLSFCWVVKIINSPHYVKNKDTGASTVLFVIGVILVALLMPSINSSEDFFEDLYLFGFFVSMAALIKWYKKTGVVLSENETTKVEQPTGNVENEKSDLMRLSESIREALYITPTGTDAYNHLIHSDILVDELIQNNIEGPNNIVKQMVAVVNHYNDLLKKRIKTKKVIDTLSKLEGTLKMVEDTLTQIYDIGIDNEIYSTEMDTEAFENLVEISGLKDSDFKLDD